MAAWFNVLLARADERLVEPNLLNLPVGFVSRQLGLPRPLIFTGGLFLICLAILLTTGSQLFYLMALIAILAQSSVTRTVSMTGEKNHVQERNWTKYVPLFAGVISTEIYLTPYMSANVFQTYWAARVICLMWVVMSLAFDHAIGTLYPVQSTGRDKKENGQSISQTRNGISHTAQFSKSG